MKLRSAALLFFVFLSTCCLAGDLEQFNLHFRLLPVPQKVEVLAGKGLLFTDLTGVYLENTMQKPVMGNMLSGLSFRRAGGEGVLSLIIHADLKLPSPEGYLLEVKAKQVTIQATTDAGLFYGIQTLTQLLQDAQNQQLEIPALKITDYPEIAYRAIHLDVKHHIDAGKYYYDMVDQLASVKINAIIIEFEDKLRYRKAPVVGAADAISIEEFAALSKYAIERHVEISPLIQGLGHASFILKHEEYKNVRDDIKSDWVFDPLNPATYEVQFALYEDAMAATPYGKYLHVGGDEVGDLGKSELSKKSGKNPFELQMYWLGKVTDFAARHNRIPIFWDDMVFKLSGLYRTTYDETLPTEEVKALWAKNRHILDESLALFPKNCAYMRWNYSSSKIPGNQLAIDWYKEHNLSVMAATSAQAIWAMTPRNQSNFQPIKDFCQLTSEKKMSGILCTVWDDASVHLETLWRGLYDFGLMSWNYEDMPVDKAHVLFRQRFYGPALADPSNDFQDLLENALPFWEKALISEGDRENYHKSFKLMELPDPKKPGAWHQANAARVKGAKAAAAQYAVIRDRIKKANESSNRNQYALSVFNEINELQVYSSNLLILVDQYDQAPAKNKKAAAAQLRQLIESFPAIRARMEKVYGETRILGNPEGYQLDSNFHEHLANGTNNTDWMYMYELPMNGKVSEWLSRQVHTAD